MYKFTNSVHRREAKLKFCNVSKVDAEVFFSLQENNSDIFIIEPEKLFIPVFAIIPFKIYLLLNMQN